MTDERLGQDVGGIDERKGNAAIIPEDPSASETLIRRGSSAEDRAKLIRRVAEEMGLSLTPGNKKAIRKACLKHTVFGKHFTASTFDAAWKSHSLGASSG
jgi:hypothetical protein